MLDLGCGQCEVLNQWLQSVPVQGCSSQTVASAAEHLVGGSFGQEQSGEGEAVSSPVTSCRLQRYTGLDISKSALEVIHP